LAKDEKQGLPKRAENCNEEQKMQSYAREGGGGRLAEGEKRKATGHRSLGMRGNEPALPPKRGGGTQKKSVS